LLEGSHSTSHNNNARKDKYAFWFREKKTATTRRKERTITCHVEKKGEKYNLPWWKEGEAHYLPWWEEKRGPLPVMMKRKEKKTTNRDEKENRIITCHNKKKEEYHYQPW
jgi:hypothetical protein